MISTNHFAKKPTDILNIQLRKLVFILLISISQVPMRAQKIEVEAAVDGVFYGSAPFKFYAVSIVGGYTPYKAIFSINSGLSYSGYFDYLGIPLNLHFKIGNNVKLRVPVGVTPFMRLDKRDWENSFGVIKNAGIGVEFKITSRINLCADIGLSVIPQYEEQDDKWGREPVFSLNNNKYGFYRLGVRYEIKGN